MDYIMCTYKRQGITGDALQARQERLKLYFYAFNGRVGLPGVHWTMDGCPNEARLRQMALAVILWVILPGLPSVPCMGKWEKQGAAVDYVIIGDLNRMQSEIFRDAFQDLVMTVRKLEAEELSLPDRSRQERDEALVNPEVAPTAHWHKASTCIA